MESVGKSQAKSRRSRAGCSSCRRQRIKCDEDYPRCQQCKKRGRHCNLAEARFRSYAPPGSSPNAAPMSPPSTIEAPRGEVDEVAGTHISYRKQRRFQILVDLAGSELEPFREPSANEDDKGPDTPRLPSHPPVTERIDPLPRSRDRNSWSNHPPNHFRDSPSPPSVEGRPVTPQSGVTATYNQDLATILETNVPSVSRILETAGFAPLNQLPPLHETSVEPILHGNSNAQRDSRATDSHQLPPLCSPVRSAKYDVSIRYGVENAEERAFLLRYFGARPGRWMDLFDLDLFYSREVPVLALHSPILMFSACAFAARQLSLTSNQPTLDACRSYSERRHDLMMQHRDWTWIAESYYDAAISLLRKHTSDVAAQDSGSSIHDNDEIHYIGGSLEEANRAHSESLTGAKLRDQVVAAVIILANYEFLKGEAPNWSDHLDGTRSFLRLCDEAGFLAFGPSSPLSSSSLGPPRLLHAAFWNFARQDMLSALIHRQRTRLEMEDIAMWRRMGINLGDDGRLNSDSTSPATQQWTDRIDMVSNTMIWLLAKLVNFINTIPPPGEDATDVDININLGPSDGADSFILESWLSLRDELQVWHKARPLLFQPCSRVALPTPSHRRTGSVASMASSTPQDCRCRSRPLINHESWYSESMCASTMQSYHMVQIFLLLHKPPSVSVQRLYRALGLSSSAPRQNSLPDTLSDFTLMKEMLNHHAVEICAIALSRPDEAARVHMLQPLYMAGRCLTDIADRRTVVMLIDSIEDELGWHAKYRVEALLEEWEMTREMLDCACVTH